MADALSAGLMSGGITSVNIGVATTPTTAYAARTLNAVAAVTVTASHNPPEYTGIKFWNSDGSGFSVQQQHTLEKIVLNGQFNRVPWMHILPSQEGVTGMGHHHIRAIVDAVQVKNQHNIVVDCAWGTGSLVTPYVLQHLQQKITVLNAPHSGRYYHKFCGDPLQVPETEEWRSFVNFGDLRLIMKATGADLAIVHDGDADRVLALDHEGNVIGGDRLVALFMDHLLSFAENRGKPVVTTVSSSLVVEEVASKYDSAVVRTPVGDVFVSEAVKSKNAVFGGEPSGPLVFPDFHYCPDGPLAVGKLVEIIDQSGKSLKDLLSQIPKFPLEKLTIKCEDTQKDTLMKFIARELPQQVGTNSEVNLMDGVRITLPDNSWILIRPSGTEPVIRVTIEAKTKKKLDEISKVTAEVLKESKNH
jgi:phosphoglucosamine mutase